MAKKNFILLSLEDSETRDIANVVSNRSCKKILDYLAEKDHSTESEIAKELKIAISTVHYNLTQLVKAGLVVIEEYHYSPKGKEVNHYKLANKYIIITPKKVKGIASRLKDILPATLIASSTAAMIYFATEIWPKFGLSKESTNLMATPMAADMAEESVAAGARMAKTAAEDAVFGAPQMMDVAQPLSAEYSIALWFLLGALFAMGAYMIIDYFRKK